MKVNGCCLVSDNGDVSNRPLVQCQLMASPTSAQTRGNGPMVLIGIRLIQPLSVQLNN